MSGRDFPDVDELREGEEYRDKLYLDSDWMNEMYQVYVFAEGLNISFKRPGHNLEIYITKNHSSTPTTKEET